MTTPDITNLSPLAVIGAQGGHSGMNHSTSGAAIITPSRPTTVDALEMPTYPALFCSSPFSIPVASYSIYLHSVGNVCQLCS